MLTCHHLFFVCLASMPLLSAATLERLTMDQMIDQSTEIVRARLISSAGVARGPVIYTAHQLQVLESLKGKLPAQTVVYTPGGTAMGLQQSFSGSPELKQGQEYVLFLWMGKSGLRQVIGLSQGAFTLRQNAAGEMVAAREPSRELMLSPDSGTPVKDDLLSVRLTELRRRVGARAHQEHRQ